MTDGIERKFSLNGNVYYIKIFTKWFCFVNNVIVIYAYVENFIGLWFDVYFLQIKMLKISLENLGHYRLQVK